MMKTKIGSQSNSGSRTIPGASSSRRSAREALLRPHLDARGSRLSGGVCEFFLACCGDRIRWAKNLKTLGMIRYEPEIDRLRARRSPRSMRSVAEGEDPRKAGAKRASCYRPFASRRLAEASSASRVRPLRGTAHAALHPSAYVGDQVTRANGRRSLRRGFRTPEGRVTLSSRGS